jgi:hypothetical protein
MFRDFRAALQAPRLQLLNCIAKFLQEARLESLPRIARFVSGYRFSDAGLTPISESPFRGCSVPQGHSPQPTVITITLVPGTKDLSLQHVHSSSTR